MPSEKEKIKNLMISLLQEEGILSTIMSDSGTNLTIRFNPDAISMDDLYDLAEPLRDLGISITYLKYTA